MSTDWNERYRGRVDAELSHPRDWLVEHCGMLPKGGMAFEAACGDGGNLEFLDRLGFSIVAADFSVEAVRLAKRRCPAANVIQTDLSNYRLPKAAFDLICNFYYLEWRLIDQYAGALKPGGLVVMETLNIGILSMRPDIQPHFLLQPGQLTEYFSGWDILDAREGWFETDSGKRKSIGSIVARRR